MAHTELGSRILKVNHAGEFGAIAIYTGQILIARLLARDLVPELVQFRSHERRHRAVFGAELARRGRRRCRSYWLCGLGGLSLGMMTGVLGRSAISATTVAVESVVLRHLDHQLTLLDGRDAAAVEAINAIVEDERAHHEQAALHVDTAGIRDRVLRPLVAMATEAVIWLGMKL
jgi:3-demethoxyubiquinol 3-hydroxylase